MLNSYRSKTSSLNINLNHVRDVRWSLVVKSLINKHEDFVINSLFDREPV